MKRIRLKKQYKITIKSYLAILFLSLVIFLILIFSYIGNNVNPKIRNYAEMKSKKIVSAVLTEAVNKDTINELKNKELFIRNKNDSSSIDFNPVAINEMIAAVSKNVKTYLKKLEKGDIKDLDIGDNTFNVSKKNLKNGIIYEFPTGIIFNNGFLSNIGPKIPIKLSYEGNATVDLVTSVKDYGINNAIIEVGIKVVVTEKVVLPFDTSDIKVETIVPISIKLIEGDVPSYYYNDPVTKKPLNNK